MQFIFPSLVPNSPAVSGPISPTSPADSGEGKTGVADFSALLAGVAASPGASPASATGLDARPIEPVVSGQAGAGLADLAQTTPMDVREAPAPTGGFQAVGANAAKLADVPLAETAAQTASIASTLRDDLCPRTNGRATAARAAGVAAESKAGAEQEPPSEVSNSRSRKTASAVSDEMVAVAALSPAPTPPQAVGGPLAPTGGDFAASSCEESAADAVNASGAAPFAGMAPQGRSGGKALAMAAARAMFASDFTTTVARSATVSPTTTPVSGNVRAGVGQGSVSPEGAGIAPGFIRGQGDVASSFDPQTAPLLGADGAAAEPKLSTSRVDADPRGAPAATDAPIGRDSGPAAGRLSPQIPAPADVALQRPTANPPVGASPLAAVPTSAAAVDQTRAPGAMTALPPGAAENIAAESSGSAAMSSFRRATAFKYQLHSDEKELTSQGPRIGIDGAQPSATMPAGSILDRSLDRVAPPAPAAAEVRSESALPQPVALVSTAHRAVEAVLDATERFAARDQHSVNLQFSVGGSDLNVRVELRGNEVHTTFRTDSPELRNALATEWQAVTGSNAEERSVRLATPVFTANANANAGFSGDDSRRQPAPDREQPTTWSTFTPDGGDRMAGKAVDQSATPSRTTAANSRHLHTLA